MSLNTYRVKRKLLSTSEPKGKKVKSSSKKGFRFVIQKHAARHLHYDFRLELDGVLKSWAIPKGPSLNSNVKRLAIQVEDHPLDYASFEGTIPKGHYGAGTVVIWDQGTYFVKGVTKQEHGHYVRKKLETGEFTFYLSGNKMRGEFTLVRLKKSEKDNEWLLIKKKDNDQDTSDLTKLNQLEPSDDTMELKDLLALATKASMPNHPKPMLAYLVAEAFDRKNWIFEIKWDGYRALAQMTGSSVMLYSRNLLSYNEKFPSIIKSLQKLKGEMILDGEIVVLDPKGRAQFQLLQNYLNTQENCGALQYCIFDILYYQGYDLRNLSLLHRKLILKLILRDISLPHLLYSDYIEELGLNFYQKVSKKVVEGIIAKDAESHYVSKRSKSWLKIKTHFRQEAIICGFTQPKGTRQRMGALILGLYQKGSFYYVGHVGSGFSQKSIKDVYALLEPLIVLQCPFQAIPKVNMPATWVKPKLVCEVSFQEWTVDGFLRQPIFQGIRYDKLPKNVIRENAVQLQKKATKNSPERNSKETSIQKMISNPDKIFWPKDRYTKGDLLEYYRQVSNVLLFHLKDRPIVLHRYPDGIDGEGFFQKESPHFIPNWISTANIPHSNKIMSYMLIQDLRSLLYVANLGSIELHPFLSRHSYLDYPDFLILDLDPENLPFQSVIEVAKKTYKLLREWSIESFCKTSGKRGIHLYIPLQAQYTFEQVENFAKLLAHLIHQAMPEITSVTRNPADRPKKVYIDFLQNARTKTMVAPYSVRAVEGALVSTPLEWSEVKKGLNPHDFTIQSVPKRIKKKGDLFKATLGKGINIQKCLSKLEKKSDLATFKRQ